MPVVSCCEYSARRPAAAPVVSGLITSPNSTTSGSVLPLPPRLAAEIVGALGAVAPRLQDGQNTTKPPPAVTVALARSPKIEKLLVPAGAWIRIG